VGRPPTARGVHLVDRRTGNLRTAFRWAADNGVLNVAAAIAACAAIVGPPVENYEPIGWAEELIEPARAVDHPRLAALCVGASLCCLLGRFEEAVRYGEVGQTVIAAASDNISYLGEVFFYSAYLFVGQPERFAELCRAPLARGQDTHIFVRANLVLALAVSGSTDEAMVTAKGLIEAAEAIGNPYVLAYSLFAYSWAVHNADPVRSAAALRRALVIAQDSGNRFLEDQLASFLSGLEDEHGDRTAALDYLTVAIRNHHESGGGLINNPLAMLAAFLDRHGCYEPAATIAGYARVNRVSATLPYLGPAITHLRDVLGEAHYENLARKGETMTAAEMVNFAYDQIDQARAGLTAAMRTS
jgi:hypothetical protein